MSDLMMAKKIRIDRLMVEKGFAENPDQALRLLMGGMVYSGGIRVDKAGTKVSDDSEIRVISEEIPYVSRGGLKLEAAIKGFDVEIRDKIALDLGVSTGGFTDCLIQHGAKLVYAVDVGYGQIDWRLRQDKRVVLFERTNFRHLKRDAIPDEIDIITMDLSFISIKKVLQKAAEFLKEKGEIIALIKPQFEVDKGEVERGGLVTDKECHRRVIEEISNFSKDIGFYVKGVIPSPISGHKGNKEYLIYLVR